MSGAEVKLYPTWRQVEADLLVAGLQDGATVSMEYLRTALGLQDPHTLQGEEAIREQAQFNFAMGDLKDSLLTNHSILLRLVPGVGYMVIPPADQTRVAVRDEGAEIQNALIRAQKKVQHVRADLLTDDQRRENADAQAKISTLSALISRRRVFQISAKGPP